MTKRPDKLKLTTAEASEIRMHKMLVVVDNHPKQCISNLLVNILDTKQRSTHQYDINDEDEGICKTKQWM